MSVFFLFCLLRHIPVTSLESDYFEGSGYAKVMLEKFPNYLSIVQKVQTRSEDALLLYLGDENNVRIDF